MQLHLVDINPAVAEAWRKAFAAYPEVSIEQADICAVARNAVVSPANSFGFMDGGIDKAYLELFGPGIQAQLQAAIGRRPEGQLPVGASLVVPTDHTRIPYLIVAPTMTTPEAVPAEHAYRALRAVLRIAASEPDVGKAVYCPGLGTLTGRVPPEAAAREMAAAYRDWKASVARTSTNRQNR